VPRLTDANSYEERPNRKLSKIEMSDKMANVAQPPIGQTAQKEILGPPSSDSGKIVAAIFKLKFRLIRSKPFRVGPFCLDGASNQSKTGAKVKEGENREMYAVIVILWVHRSVDFPGIY
jgi:hypothetical protein